MFPAFPTAPAFTVLPLTIEAPQAAPSLTDQLLVNQAGPLLLPIVGSSCFSDSSLPVNLEEFVFISLHRVLKHILLFPYLSRECKLDGLGKDKPWGSKRSEGWGKFDSFLSIQNLMYSLGLDRLRISLN